MAILTNPLDLPLILDRITKAVQEANALPGRHPLVDLYVRPGGLEVHSILNARHVTRRVKWSEVLATNGAQLEREIELTRSVLLSGEVTLR